MINIREIFVTWIWLIEARDEFEDPEEDIRRIYVLKLFNGLQEWNYGLFVQEIFKLETKESFYIFYILKWIN